MLSFDEESLERRAVVWVALSDLFLDTDVSLSYDYIARVCSESTYTLAELKEILESEVAPTCSANLLSVAGEWAGFDEEWLVNNIRNNIRTKHEPLTGFLKPFENFGFKSYIKDHWKKLEVIIIEKRIKA
ncbi:MAG: hypothetical protein V4732_07625 [Pseudomonadota bacterium]